MRVQHVALVPEQRVVQEPHVAEEQHVALVPEQHVVPVRAQHVALAPERRVVQEPHVAEEQHVVRVQAQHVALAPEPRVVQGLHVAEEQHALLELHAVQELQEKRAVPVWRAARLGRATQHSGQSLFQPLAAS